MDDIMGFVVFLISAVIAVVGITSKKQNPIDLRKECDDTVDIDNIAMEEADAVNEYYPTAYDTIYEKSSDQRYSAAQTSTYQAVPTVHDPGAHKQNSNVQCSSHAPIESYEGKNAPTTNASRLRLTKDPTANKSTIGPIILDEVYDGQKSYIEFNVVRDLSYDTKSLVGGIIYSEIFGKPKSQRH